MITMLGGVFGRVIVANASGERGNVAIGTTQARHFPGVS